MVHRHAAERRQTGATRARVGPEIEFLLVLTKLDDLFRLDRERTTLARSVRKSGRTVVVVSP